MASINDGRYFVYNLVMYGLSATNYCLTSPANATNGTNATITTETLAYGQVFQVSTLADGSRVITSVSSGKSLTSPGTAGEKIDLYNAAGATQKWNIVDAGTTATINGATYDVFNIEDFDDSTLAMLCISNSAYVGDATTRTASYQFCFVPASIFHSGGAYELRPVSNTGMAIESFQGTANEVNVCLGTATHDNTQKFIIEEVSSWGGLAPGDTAYTIRNIARDKYISLPRGDVHNGTSVIVTARDTTRVDMLWKLTPTGTSATVDGVACAVYTIHWYYIDPSTQAEYAIDTESATLHAFTDIVVNEAWASNAQKFALLPTDALDPSMAVPYELGIADTDGGEGKLATDDVDANGRFYATWKCAAAQAADGDNHFEFRYRTRQMNSESSTWQNWTNWTSWKTPLVSRNGRQAWYSNGYGFAFGDGTTWYYKALQYEFQVRSAGTASTALIHGKAADVVAQVYKRVDVEITSATWTPDGLRLDFTDDYPYGTTYVNFLSLTDGTDEYFADAHSCETSALTGTTTIPLDKFASWPEENETLELAYKVGYDQRAPWYVLTDEIAVSYTGGTVSVTPTFVQQGARLLAIVPDLGETRLWVNYDRTLYECFEAEDYATETGYKAFEVLYPMKKAFKVFVSSTNSDGSQWGTTMVSRDALPYVFHAFTWKGGSVYLQRFAGERGVATSISPVYEADVLDSRARETVSYAPTVKVRKSVSGVLLSDDPSTMSDLIKLANKHVIYRSPLGGMHDVAITGITTTERGNRTEVTVDMVEEEA